MGTVVSTVDSFDIKQVVEARDKIDWAIVEEATEMTVRKLLGALMLSGRRLFIGDHRRLPQFDADRMIKMLHDNSVDEATFQEASRQLAP